MAYKSKGKVKTCPICESDQHVVSENETDFYLGCGHTLSKDVSESPPDDVPNLGTELEPEPDITVPEQ